MKYILYKIFLIAIFVLILIFPNQTFTGATSGLMLWFDILLPTLLPFIIITSLIVKTQAFSLISRIFNPLLQRLFQTSPHGSFAIVVGFLCGYPMGAKVIHDLYTTSSITRNEAQYLLSFCNNTSPMFIISFVVNQTLKDHTLMFPLFFSTYLSAIIISLFTRKYYLKRENNFTGVNIEKQKLSLLLIDNSIMDGIGLITKIGGYVMLFSIMICLGTSLFNTFLPIITMFLPLLEITNGIQIYQEGATLATKLLPIIFLVSFGGLCAIAQTQCVLEDSDLKICPYIIQKIITAIIAVIISSFFIIIFY